MENRTITRRGLLSLVGLTALGALTGCKTFDIDEKSRVRTQKTEKVEKSRKPLFRITDKNNHIYSSIPNNMFDFFGKSDDGKMGYVLSSDFPATTPVYLLYKEQNSQHAIAFDEEQRQKFRNEGYKSETYGYALKIPFPGTLPFEHLQKGDQQIYTTRQKEIKDLTSKGWLKKDTPCYLFTSEE